ncbi:MAG: hypothetical protein A3J79_04305 [Elusimicrobia bacterium RIFOXYB2_FULL_62_6]|nr:MAG: hypothetical protein A3J79_04305 [Elusimicrobia bacterium RIFOXYB2_FULL_62_6]
MRAFERYLAARSPKLQDLKVALEGDLVLNGNFDGAGFSWSAAMNGRPPVIDLQKAGVTPTWSWTHWDVALDAYPPVIDLQGKGLFNGLMSVPGFFLKFFSFSYDISQWPYYLSYEKTKRNKNMLEIHSKSSKTVEAAHPERIEKVEPEVFY